MGEKQMEKLLSQKEMAEILGLSVRALENFRKDKGLPFYKIGHLIKYRMSEVEKWLKERQGDE